MHSLVEIYEALQAKLMWAAMSGNTLWAKYAKSKYLCGDEINDRANASPLWRTLQAFFPILCEQSRWVLGSGEKRFWADNWLGERLVGPLPMDASMTIATGLKIITDLWHLIPVHLHSRIQEISLNSTCPDTLVYAPNDHGRFSTKTFLATRRPRTSKRRWNQWIWASFFPPDLSTFLWKLLKHALPVDTRVQSRGIYLASGCRCCRDRSEESLVHLFIYSDIARQVWQAFANIFKLPGKYSSTLQALNIWMAGCSDRTQYGVLRMACSAYIFKEIWVSRCSATYDDRLMNFETIRVKVLNRIRTLNLVVARQIGSTALQNVIIEHLGIAGRPIRIKRGIWCKWESPSPGWFKLNVDGSARGIITTGGGVIRNHQGDLIAAFSAYYGAGTNNSAELLALKEGMHLCKALHLSPILIESDSTMVVAAIRTAKIDNWRLRYIFRECLTLYTSDLEIVHGYRQKNMVADRLADVAYKHRRYLEFYRDMDLPSTVRKAFMADKLGLWSFRP